MMDGNRAIRHRMGVAGVAGYATVVGVGKVLPGNGGGLLMYCLFFLVYCIAMVPLVTALALQWSGRTRPDKWEVTGLLMLVGLGVAVVILLAITHGGMGWPLYGVRA